MHPEAHRIVEKEALWQNRSRHAMTAQARSLGMAIHAELSLRGRSYAVFPDEIARVNEVIVRTNAFVAQVHMTRIATILRELVFVRVTASAGCHTRPQNFGAARDVHVASHAIASNPGHMSTVLESQVRARHFGASSGMRQSVTIATFSIVVRFLVASHAISSRRQVQGAFFAGRRNSDVATIAMNPLERMRTMLEGSASRWSNAQNGRACGREQETCAQEQRRLRGFHGPPHE